MDLTDEETAGADDRVEELNRGDNGRKSAWSLRKKEKRSYDDAVDEDEIVGRRNFNLEERIQNTRNPSPKFYVELKGSDLTLRYFQRNGFSCPIIVKDKSGLGMRIPSPNFSVSDVKRCVGSYRLLDVVDVNTQRDLVMTVKDWVQYYETPERNRLLNVISLEFSHTRLEDYVDQPEVIHELDWADLAWPWHLKQYQTEPTNIIEKMMYPKVQKYCLMSVKGCYTDFHIDMGGTSVWYHILKGKKIFWLIPPTEENLQLYENWTLSGKQGDVFFGDVVSTCYHILLEAGWTFFIPPGWIHAVYTPEDSLVFGGNFLHSFNVTTQLRVWEVETKTHVPSKFRYPFFIEIHWYVLERYVSCLLDKHHRVKSVEEEQIELKGEELSEKVNCSQEILSRQTDGESSIWKGGTHDAECSSDPDQSQISMASVISSSVDLPVDVTEAKQVSMNRNTDVWVCLTPYELEGLKTIIHWLENLPQPKRHIPKDIPDGDSLLSDAKLLLKLHLLDDSQKSVTGVPALQWSNTPKKIKRKRKAKAVSASSKQNSVSRESSSGKMWHYRRIRCKACEPCTRSDCGECIHCRDMRKFGGSGRKKQTCISRRCLAPLLPRHAVCQKCSQGGDQQLNSSDGSYDTCLMECRICFNILHPKCLKEFYPQLTHSGTIDEDYPNSWECGKCCEAGRSGQGKHRFNRISLCDEFVQIAAQPATPLQSPEFMMLSKENDELVNISSNSVKGSMSSLAEAVTDPFDRTECVTKGSKRKQVQHYDDTSKRKECISIRPLICVEKLPKDLHAIGSRIKLHFNSDQPTGSISLKTMKKKKSPSLPYTFTSSSSTSSSASSSPSKSSRINSRGREIMIPRRFLP